MSLELPLSMVRLFSIHYQVTVSFSTLLFAAAAVLAAGYLVVRYKYLTRFSANSSASAAKNVDLDSLDKKKPPAHKPAPSNYLDEFLSAIKIFGYLERSVFHELTKNMTTQRLSWDELLYLDDRIGFSIVVDGVVQVFTKVDYSPGAHSSLKDLDYETDDVLTIGPSRYHLLNEVKTGAPLSSLLSTLDLFSGRSGSSGSASPLNYESDSSAAADHPDIIARPKPGKKGSGGATIAIIPAAAFERVSKKYPKSTSHIVAMVKNRLFKVTMNTIHHYLGLTHELVESEVKLNTSIDHQLPTYLSNTLIEKYSPGGLAERSLVPSSVNSSSSLSKLQKRGAPELRFMDRTTSSSRIVSLSSTAKASHPGDLLSSVPISRKSVFNFDQEAAQARVPETFTSDREETEETSTRIAIVENIFKIIGIDEDSEALRNVRSQSLSVTSSRSSSVLGLPGLMSADTQNANPLENYNKNSIYENYTNRVRLDSMSSFGSANPSRVSSPKHYNTINHAQLKTINSFNLNNIDQIFEAKSRKSGAPAAGPLDFNVIKDEIAKVLEIKHFGPDEVLIEQDSFQTGFYYVVDGTLNVQTTKETGRENKLVTNDIYTIKAGGIAGFMSTFLGFRSLVNVRTSSDDKGVIVAYLSRSSFSNILDKYYYFQLPVAVKLKSLLSKQLLTIDFALEWCNIPAGEVLASQGDFANGFHIVLSGRFRVIQYKKRSHNDLIDESSEQEKRKPKYVVLGEYGHGESVGEVEVLTASRRTNSLVAVRDSETARIPRTLFEILSLQNPSIMVKVSRIVANKAAKSNQSIDQFNSTITTPITNTSSPFASNIALNSTNYKTITVLPTTSGLPVREFADKLIAALKTIGRNVIALDQTSVLTHLGRHAFDESLSQLKLSGYFAYLEEEYENVIYICDSAVKSSWTSTCISQGDCILLLANSTDYDTAIGIGEYEELLVDNKTTAKTDLCLLHPEKFVTPGSTSVWLKHRTWVNDHHHLEMKVGLKLPPIKEKKPNIISELAAVISEKTNPQLKARFENVRSKMALKVNRQSRFEAGPPVEIHKNDFLRLARLLTNEAIGLVLGGGGARGISHLGVVTALERRGIPVDIIGGTSIGSFVGGLYANEYNLVSIYGKVKKFSKRISSFWRMLFDLTYPVTSYITGYEFNRGIWKAFGFAEIEDTWIKFYCNSTNITNSCMEIHETGYAWRFIRASMSLAGLLPPISYGGSMLLDGGYLDNLPVLEMKKRGIKYIIAVDVGSVDDRTPQNYGDTLSGFWVLWNRWNPFSREPNVPNMADIQLRLAYVSSVNALEIAKSTPGVMYLRPPIEGYGTLDFGKFEEVYEVGLRYAEGLLNNWETQGKLPHVAGTDSSLAATQPGPLFRRNSL